jgi:hypothetical protein
MNFDMLKFSGWNGTRWCVRSIPCFDSVSEKSQITKEGECSAEKKRRVLGITKM